MLTVFRGMMNFVKLVTTPNGPTSAIEYSVFKIRFLTVYQILRSLQLMRDDQSQPLTPGQLISSTE
jgi:hypothetical protein